MNVMLQLFRRRRGARVPSSRTSSIRSRTGRRSGRCRRGPRRHYARTAVAFRLQHKHVQPSGKRPQSRLAAKGDAPPWTLTLRNVRLLSAIACAISSTTMSVHELRTIIAQQTNRRSLETDPGHRGAEAEGPRGRAVEPLHAAGRRAPACRRELSRSRARSSPISNMRSAPRRWAASLVARGVQLLRARHRQHGGAPPLRHARAEGRVA